MTGTHSEVQCVFVHVCLHWSLQGLTRFSLATEDVLKTTQELVKPSAVVAVAVVVIVSFIAFRSNRHSMAHSPVWLSSDSLPIMATNRMAVASVYFTFVCTCAFINFVFCIFVQWTSTCTYCIFSILNFILFAKKHFKLFQDEQST